jgi:O-antigen/teichoic acid export membrane protein
VKKLLSDTTFTGLSQLIASLTQIVLQIFVVRFTSKQSFGEFITANTIENLIEVIFVTRSGDLALQYVGKYWIMGDHLAAKICANRIIKLDWIVNFSIYAFIIVGSIFLSNFTDFNPIYLVGLSLQIPAQIGYGVYKSIFISSCKIREQAIFEITYSFGNLLLCFITISFLGIPGLIIAFVISAFFKNYFARIITCQWWLPVNYSKETWVDKENWVNAESWWNFSTHSMLRNTFISASNQVDILMINAFQGAESTATYKVAKSLSSLPVRIIAPIWSVLRPRLMYAYHSRDSNKILKLITVPAAIMLGFLVIAIIPIYFFADALIVNIYGRGYISSTLPFLILLIGTWIYTSVTAWFNFWIVISDQMRLGTDVSGFFLTSILILGIFLGRHSPVYMAIAVASSMIITSAMCWLFFLNKLQKLNKIKY